MWLTIGMERLAGARFPWGTLLINVIGSLIIGFVAACGLPGARAALPTQTRIFLMVGVCGGFTTFSSFSLQTLGMLQKGQAVAASFYAISSVVLCVLASGAGMALGRAG
jgi:fluoride exporter